MSNGRVPASCPPNFSGRYTVRAGETMFIIAQRYGVSLNALIAANPHISNPALLFAGDVLCVPGTAPGPGPDCRTPRSCPSGFQGRYTVRAGDSMYSIAQRFGVSLNALIAANPHISNPSQLRPCDVLCVPGSAPGPGPDCREPASCPPGFQGRYTVRAGDSMYSIAQRFGVSLNALIAANPHISNPSQLRPCDVLCVPGSAPGPGPDCREPASCPPGFQGRYTVRAGDSMYSIAQRFGVSLNALIAANPHISNPSQLRPCDVLCVPGTAPGEGSRVALLNAPTGTITDAKGSVLVRLLATNQRSISVLGVGIPVPSSLGNFDSYEASISLPPPEGATFELFLSPTSTIPSQPTTWSGSLNLILGSGWPLDTMIVIRPINTTTGVTGAAVLRGTLAKCTE